MEKERLESYLDNRDVYIRHSNFCCFSEQGIDVASKVIDIFQAENLYSGQAVAILDFCKDFLQNSIEIS